MAGYPPPPGGTAQSAIIALILGLCGIFICPIASPFAWHYGGEAEQTVRASGGQVGGAGLATAGKILGIIGTVFLAFYVVVLVLVFVAGVSFLTLG